MNVRKVYGFAKTVGIVESKLLSVFIQPIPFAVVIEDRAKNPAMSMEVSELRGLQLLVEFRTANILEKLFLSPESAHRRRFRIAKKRLVALVFAGVALLLRVHFVSIDFVVPPGKPEISGDHVRAGMNVTNHALTGRDGARESVFDGMGGFVFGNGGIARSAYSGVAETRVRPRVCRIAIVRINHMASRAAAGAIVAGMVVGAGERHDGIEQACFLQPEKNRIGAQPVPKPRSLSLSSGLPGSSSRLGLPISAFLRPPRSNTRSTFPGWEVSQRKRGSSSGITPLARVSSGVGLGDVLIVCGTPLRS